LTIREMFRVRATAGNLACRVSRATPQDACTIATRDCFRECDAHRPVAQDGDSIHSAPTVRGTHRT
jgi:hypothetical protein